MTASTLILASLLGGSPKSTVDFDTDIVPILTRSSCNAGACHGSAAGRGGFRLSLYGGDPEFDHRSIASALNGRRVNLAHPERSLVVMKPSGELDHGGGYRLEYDGPNRARLLQWIADGAPRAKTRRLERFDVQPTSCVVEQTGAAITLVARATFSDGSARDVTPLTVFAAEDASAVDIDDSATATVRRRGRHLVIARYLDRVVPVELLVPLSDDAVDLSQAPRHNFIDDEIHQRLQVLRLPLSPQTDDATFLRRLRIDLTGRLPDTSEVVSFLADGSDDKRSRLIDRLMGSDEFVDYWTFEFAKLLRIRSQPQDSTGARTYHEWLRKQVEQGAPYNNIARQLITAVGDSHEHGPANFYRTVNGAREQAEFVSELFMGVRLRCANCHNHPLDRWTQDDYHGLAAVFAKLERGRVIRVGTRGDVTHPRTGSPAVARIPGDRFLDNSSDGRAALGDWLTDDANPWFSRAIVNRLWQRLMGRGLVEPADDLRATNPATHPDLLARLADDFIQHDFDWRRTIRLICRSAAYARSSAPTDANRADDRFYSHAIIRPLQPEVLADAIADVTGVPGKYGDEALGTRAVTLFDPKIESEALDILGRCSREESCEADGSSATGGLSQRLHLINGPLINRRISDPEGRLRQLLVNERTPDEIVAEFYIRCLGRIPTDEEAGWWHKQFDHESDPGETRRVLEDVVWSLLSCREFVTNH